jgi:hypothetical protein
LSGGKTSDGYRTGDAEGVLDLLWLLLVTVLAWIRLRHDLVRGS